MRKREDLFHDMKFIIEIFHQDLSGGEHYVTNITANYHNEEQCGFANNSLALSSS